jgi:hypothetical protein
MFRETDTQNLPRLVEDVETAMSYRLRALSSSSDGHVERRAIADAANNLLMIKKEILGVPGLEFTDRKEDRAKTEPD